MLQRNPELELTTLAEEDILEPLAVPTEIRAAYGISDSVLTQRLSGGLVNETLLVHDQGETTVMRQLSGVLSADTLEDSHVIGTHLTGAGWEAPTHLPTRNGAIHAVDAAGLVWHRMNYIASDGVTPTATKAGLPEAAGEMIGAWHATVRPLNYRPKFSIDHFHDTAYYANKLQCQLEDMPDQGTYELAREALQGYRSLPTPNTHDEQIIHGDPKLDNMLFRDGRPFTLIDFDTVMYGSPWIDVGDFLRSITGKLLQKGITQPPIESFVESYRDANELQESVDEAVYHAAQATGRIAVELSMRYLSDIVDREKYFSWDPSQYTSRRNNHLARAALQLEVVQLVRSEL